MAIYNYGKYKILIDPESKKTQGLKVGDIVRRQYFDNPNLIYSLMIVLETGIDIIREKESSYFIGALIEGDKPVNGELLDFVRITNLYDPDRSGALYLTASDSESPYMDVIDGLAYNNSLCYPYMSGGRPGYADKNKYSCTGKDFLETEYKGSAQEADRIFRVSRNNISNPAGILGIQQTIEKELSHPQRLIISFKGRASKKMEGIPVSFGYTDDPEQVDGQEVINIDTHWQYYLFMVTIDLPSHYQRSFYINLTKELSNAGDWFEIADLNIVLQSDMSVFSNATKARVGKIKGIVDPVFGILEGYGAYFQNMYATRNVNIAGTLTAGDENGFSSTFYVGKIHKNVILNSIDCDFEGDNIVVVNEHTPVGIGKVWKIGTEVKLKTQTPQWRNEHTGQKYVFSLWIKDKANEKLTVSVFQDEHHIEDLNIISSEEWQRYHVVVVIKESESADFSIRLAPSVSGILITAPQFEAGIVPSQYQPTDGTLAYVEDYGAWFSKGGIGGTIQNPLLRLNNDGSISSRDNSFVINPDGTGYFASGRFKWTKDTITLQDVTIRWEDFDREAQENMLPKSVCLRGTDVFHYADELEDRCDPLEILIYATEQNFTPTARKWFYLSFGSEWKELAGNNTDFMRIIPDGHYWEGRNTLPIRYTAIYKNEIYEDIFTVYKQFDGQSAYSLYISSSNGYIFKNGIVSTILAAHIFKGGEDITARIPGKNFRWIKSSGNAIEDERWNSIDHTGKSLEITGEDVYRKAVFDCEVIISVT
ncbi:hypothetical protein IR083_07320 [Dysgonomonas sp. GY75]|uniref:hypothetical protein n=1 Tax=Dysgonomonas sp. GY75 TaxID=2780419 RepID=UPI00188476CA|nr:hypothetical protein [Dysgonomonas sp. GY75]MBF0648625.1 hypothetical protein [Dysgonomonas sp. GY75]